MNKIKNCMKKKEFEKFSSDFILNIILVIGGNARKF